MNKAAVFTFFAVLTIGLSIVLHAHFGQADEALLTEESPTPPPSPSSTHLSRVPEQDGLKPKATWNAVNPQERSTVSVESHPAPGLSTASSVYPQSRVAMVSTPSSSSAPGETLGTYASPSSDSSPSPIAHATGASQSAPTASTTGPSQSGSTPGFSYLPGQQHVAPLPLAFQALPEQVAAANPQISAGLQNLQQDFISAVANSSQDPNDPAYYQQWMDAKTVSDEQYRILVGNQAFLIEQTQVNNQQ